MGELSKLFGEPIPLGIKDIKLSPLTKAIQAKFEAYQEEQILLTAYKSKANLSASDYTSFLADVNERIASGAYSWGSEKSVACLKTESGGTYLFWLLLNAVQPITIEEAHRLMEHFPEEVLKAIEQLLPKKK